MKLSYNWLQDYVELPENCTPGELGDLLTSTGLEVEKMHTTGVSIDKVVVVQINESVQHPNADRLSVCQVDDGSGTPRQIVCGAKNYKVGDKVPAALPGAVLPGDFKIKVGKLRGVESQGMLCSSTELGLPEGADGLLILPAEATIGAPIGDLYPSDTLFDLEATPNRPDLLSHFGIAREVAALTDSPLKGVRHRKPELDFAKNVEVTAEECPFYTARCMHGLSVGPSPGWLRERIESVGVRSINSVVDVTNYVLWEMGQPLHVFDADKLQGPLRVRLAEAGEKFAALDGRTYTLQQHHLVIADDSGPVALAGVMGGEATGVTVATKRIWLESAYFCASSIRKTSRELGLMSDASYRFEREVDPAGVLVASQHAAELIQKVAGGEIGELRVGFAANSQFGFDAEGAAEGHEYTMTVPFRKDRCTALLGIEIEDDDIEGIFTGFGLRKAEGGWEIPSFRPDLTREIDLIEEIVRVVGINEIPAWHFTKFAPASEADKRYDRVLELRRTLAGLGLHEARGLTLGRNEVVESWNPIKIQQPVGVRNPLGADCGSLRPILFSGMLDAVDRNLRAGERAIRLFEVGKVYRRAENNRSLTTEEEPLRLCVVLAGEREPLSWRTKQTVAAVEFSDVLGIIEQALGQKLKLQRVPPEGRFPLFATVFYGGVEVGFAGMLSLDNHGYAVFAELDLEPWLAAESAPKRYTEVPKFPAMTRDIAFVAPLGLEHARVLETLQTPAEQLLADVALFDVFTDPSGAKVPADKKSVAYSLTYRSAEKTLTADEVNAVHTRLKERLKGSLGVQFRE